MAELTNLESKLAEVLGLAQAAKGATAKVKGLADDEQELVAVLDRMGKEAEETARRCEELAGDFDGKKTAILEQARETKQEATEMMETYLGADADALDGFEFLTMAEAGEVGHWEIVGVLASRAEHADARSLVDWALPIQKRHLEDVRTGSLKLAQHEDPNEPSG
jgi:hypothetical protein